MTQARMSRSLRDVTPLEWDELMDIVTDWLERNNVSGSIAGWYSIYNALDDEYDKAHEAKKRGLT